MPTAFRRWLGRGSLPVDDLHGVSALRVLQALLQQPHAGRQQALAIHLLTWGPFDLALVTRASEAEPGQVAATVVDGKATDLDLDLVQESLNSKISPLAGMTETPRWVALQDDPFRPGAAFLRRFHLACALILPLTQSGPGRDDHLFLLMASREALEYGDALLREILTLWKICEAVGPAAWGGESAAAGEGLADWPGLSGWLKAPTALAIVAGDEVICANGACEALLRECVGSDGHSWRVWLAASVRRLLDGGRQKDVMPASHTRQRSLEVAIGPPLGDGESRITSVRDATAEILADTQRADTISTLTHELRTPLTTMKNSVGLILRGEAGEMSEKQSRFLTMTMRNIDRLDRLIGDLLESSRAAAGQLALRRRVVDLGVLLREALEMLAATSRQRGITLDYAGVPATFPAHVDGDKVVQMIHNTVGNALKYTEEGGFVRVWLQTRQGRLPALTTMMAERYFLPLRIFTLVIEDNGMGMSEEVLKNLFRPFRRGKEAEAKQAPGTGLGLHITRGLVEAHGGTIDLSSSSDLGTTVWIVLPRDPDSERVLVASRRLIELLRHAPARANLLFLDSRRPDRQPEERELRQAAKWVRSFLTRLTREAVQSDGPAAAWPLGEEDEARVEELAPGLWVSSGVESSRLGPAWEVELAKPNCSRLLTGTKWEYVKPPVAADVEVDETTGAPLLPLRDRQ